MRYNFFLFFFLFCVQHICTYDKWIVVTTINYPTQALKKLAIIPGWRLVVVADKKTPRDWYLDNCEFLSVEKQESLDFALVKLLPWNHYARKNIGYLYAIQHGAKIIYETDDDNELLADEIIMLSSVMCENYSIAHEKLVNCYAYFGKPTIWPRGFPLNHICQSGGINFAQEITQIKPLVQQGLVNGDPDVDAIFRLTRNEIIFFECKDPLVLNKGSFCPFNTQNTVYHYDAFWGLLIPTTVSFRVADIWRSYWVQRLLWDIRAHVCFLAPTAFQVRNEHNLMCDFCDELDLYIKAESLVNFLFGWQSSKRLLSDRIKDLIYELTTLHYFEEFENTIVDAWLSDLEQCGYVMPIVEL